MLETVDCPICKTVYCDRANWSGKSAPFAFEYRYRCERCGSFILADALKDGPLNDLPPLQRSILSHRLRRMQRQDPPPPEVVKSLLPTINDRLPSPAEQADNLILWVGDHQPSPAQHVTIPEAEVASWVGTPISSNFHDEGLSWLLQQPQMQQLVKNNASLSDASRLQLTFEGWQRHEALHRNVVEGHKAFMAMKFNDEMHRVFEECFRPAVDRTGFKLQRLIDGQLAGPIDDQLRVALGTSRFVIADLTHASNGAYWEAGFAEGLGRPVIYTCCKTQWEEQKTHFDTNHLATIIWDPEDLVDAGNRLAAMIRATLPAEAKVTD
jgi:hypothetical protein